MNGLKRLRGVLSSMDANEKAVLRNYLTCFESRRKGYKPKTLILLDLLLRHADDRKVELLFKKKVGGDEARRMIASRLYDKILTSLILDVNLAREERYDKQARAMADVTLGKLKARLLLARGQRKLALSLLDRFARTAEEFELYDDLIDILKTKRQLTKPSKHDDRTWTDLQSETVRFAACREAVDAAKQAYEEVVNRYGFKGLQHTAPSAQHVAFLEERVNALGEAFKETDSATVGYYYFLLSAEHAQLLRNHALAGTALIQLAELLQERAAIGKRVRIATVLANLGENAMHAHRFKEAENYTVEAIPYMKTGTRNHVVLLEQLFYCHLYTGELEQALGVVQRISENRSVTLDPFRLEVHRFLMACVQFASGNFRDAQRTLGDCNFSGREREEWNFSRRVLQVMLAIERGESDMADSLIANIGQHIRDIGGVEVIRPRDAVILEALMCLRKNSYQPTRMQQEAASLVDRLSGKEDPSLTWTVLSPEVLCFHVWLRSMIDEISYADTFRSGGVNGL